MKALLFGGFGQLGIELRKILKDHELMCPTHKECDITGFINIEGKFDAIINCVALVGVDKCEQNKQLAYDVNVFGALNIAKHAQEKQAHLIYISSDTVYDSNKKLPHSEYEPPSPISYYALTKLLGEFASYSCDNTSIIRTSFFPRKNFKYNTVPIDQICSREPVDIIANKIKEIVEFGNSVGIMNIGGKPRSHYEIIKDYYPNVKPTTITELEIKLGYKIPKNLGMNTNYYEEFFNGDFKGN
jgi:dTDP-4-dehydrorhamnose reductase